MPCQERPGTVFSGDVKASSCGSAGVQPMLDCPPFQGGGGEQSVLDCPAFSSHFPSGA